jgi:signal transduction histidine kinase
MTRAGLLLMTLTAIVAGLAAVLAFAVLRLFAAARNLSDDGRRSGAETAFMTGAVGDALQKLKVEERAAQARAEASERLSSEIIASLTSGLLVVGADREIRVINPAGQRFLGLTVSQATGNLRVALAGLPPLVDVIEECLASGKPVFRRAVQVEGPTSIRLGVTVSPITDATGRAHGAICLFSDLSHIADLEEQLRLKDSLARVGEMTAGIAHEFRNGLATIHGYARLLDLERMPEEFRPYVTGIRDETETLRAVVTNFLNFARPTHLTPSRIDVRALVDRAVEDIRGDVAAGQGTAAVSGAFGTIEGDEVLLRQALSNLCRNALEACAAAGVRPELALEGDIDAAAAQQRIAVVDNGGGVDPRLAERLFQPFFTTKPQGTGLGLALVQKIIVTHNGRVTVESTGRTGARFVITLPLAGD